MAEHDGSINLDVRVRRDDFFKGISEIKSAIKSLQSSIEAIGAKIGSATVSNIKDINKNVNDTAATAEKVSDSVGDTTEKFKESKDEADALKKTLDGINDRQTQAGPTAGASALESPLTESANNIKEEADRFMAAAKDFFSATKGFESTIKSSKREMDASVVGYAEAMKNNAKYTQMFEAELSNLRQKQEELRQQKESMGETSADTDEYRRVSESLGRVNAEYKRMEELKNEALKPTYLQDWEKLPTVTGRVAEAFAHVKSNVQMAMYAIQHPLQAINRALFAVTSAAIRFARTSFANVVNGVKNVASSALRAASSIARMVGNLARMAGTSALSFLKRLAAGAQNAAAQLAKLAGRAIISGIKHIGSLAGRASKSLLGLNKSARGDGFKEGLRFIVRYGFGVRSMFMLVRKLRGAIVEAFQAMAQQVPEVNQTLSALKSSLDLMKYSLATAFQPILTTIQPLLTQFMDAISAAMDKVGIFFATLTGQGYIYKAAKTQSSYADSLRDTARAAKEAKNQLAGFDHLNILSAPGDSGSGASDADNAEATFEKVPIESAISDFAQRIKDAFNAGDFFGIGKIFADKLTEIVNGIDWEGIGAKAAEGINKVIAVINGFFDSFNWIDLGTKLATGINKLVEGIDWYELGRALTQKAAALIKTLYGFVSEFDWAQAGKSLGRMIQGMFDNVPWSTLANLVSTSINGIMSAITNAALNFDWAGNGQTLSDSLETMVNQIDVNQIYTALSTVLGGILDFITPILTNENVWNGIASDFAGALNNLFNDDALWTKMKLFVQLGIGRVVVALKTFVYQFKWGDAGERFHDAILDLVQNFPFDDLSSTLRGLLKGALQAMNPVLSDQSLFQDLGQRISNFFNSIFKDKELVKAVGGFANNLLKDALSFTNGVIEGFEPRTAAEAIQTALGEIEWGTIANGVWEAAKKAFNKAYNFANLLLGGEKKYDSESGNFFFDTAEGLGKNLGKKISEIVGKISWKDFGSTISKAAQGLLEEFTGLFEGLGGENGENSIGKAMADMLSSIEWGKIADGVWKAAKAAFNGAYDFVTIMLGGEKKRTSYDPTTGVMAAFGGEGLGATIGKKISDALGSIKWSDFGTIISNAAKGLFNEFTGFFKNLRIKGSDGKNGLTHALENFFGSIDWGGIAVSIINAAWQFFVTIGSTLAQLLWDAFLGIFQRDAKETFQQAAENIEKAESIAELHEAMGMQGAVSASTYFDAMLNTLTEETGQAKQGLEDFMVEVFDSDTPENLGGEEMIQFMNALSNKLFDESGKFKSEFADELEAILGPENAQAYQNGEWNMEAWFNGIYTTMNGNDETAKQAVYRILRGDPNYILDIGKTDGGYFVQGVGIGAENEETKTTNKVSGVISRMLNKIEKEDLEQGSPSKRAKRSGEYYMQGFSDGVEGEEGTTKKDVTSAFDNILDVAASFAAMNLIVTLGMLAVKNAITGKLDEIDKIIKDTWMHINSENTKGMDNTTRYLNTQMSSMTSMFKQRTMAIASDVQSSATRISSVINSQTSNIQSRVQSGFAQIASSITNNLNSAMHHVSNMNWYSIGSNIVNGIGNGINSGWSWLNNTVSNLAYSLFRSARRALGIHSPSTLFRDEVGYMVGAGLAEGINDSENVVLGSVSKMATDMVKEMDGTDMTAEIGADGDTMLNGLQSVLTTFSDNVENSFTNLLTRLQSIADNVVFKVPNVAAGNVLPYAVQGTGSATTITDTLDKSNDELISAMIQLVNNQTSAIVDAIRKYGTGTNGGVNNRGLADSIIDEINRRTRAQGYSPIQF